MELFFVGADREHLVEFHHPKQLIEFGGDVGEHNLHLLPCGPTSRINKHANTHAAHERDFCHVDDKPFVASDISQGVLQGCRNDLRLTLRNRWRME